MRLTRILSLGLLALPALADYNGTLLWDPPVDNEANVYARVIALEHAGDQNGNLLATWEHWYVDNSTSGVANGTVGSYIIRQSQDDGKTWSTLTEVTAPQNDSGQPAILYWQPFLFEFPQQLGQYPEGTILLVGNIVPADGSYTRFYAWRSADHGATWTPVGPWQTGGGSVDGVSHGIWEPFLYLDNQGRLIAMFSDERDASNHSQKLVYVVSENGGDTWGDVVGAVVSPAQTDRPGMATVALMDNGEYIMSYEICGRPMCPAHTKVSADGINWNETDTGNPVYTGDSLFPQSSPYIVWDPATKQLVLSALRIWYTNTFVYAPEDLRAVFINTNYGQGVWDWAPAPWHVSNASKVCNENYSPNLLVRPAGNIRYTAPTAHGDSGWCAEGTGEAQVGYLPYAAEFGTYGQAGWINMGGNWTTDGDSYTCSAVSGYDAKALTGSTGWKDYQVSADVRVTSDQGQVGLNTRMTAPMYGEWTFLGYMASISTLDGNLTLSRESNGRSNLGSLAVKGGVKANTWYHLTFSVQGFELEATVTGEDNSTTSVSAVDNSWSNGLVGLLANNGSAAFKNIAVNPQETSSKE